MTLRMKPTSRREEQLQRAVVQLFTLALPADAFFYSVPNEGKRSPRTGGTMKAMGLRSGVPDLVLVYRGQHFGIELKSETGRLSAKQCDVHMALQNAGSQVAVCRSLAAVEGTLAGWGIPLRATTGRAA